MRPSPLSIAALICVLTACSPQDEPATQGGNRPGHRAPKTIASEEAPLSARCTNQPSLAGQEVPPGICGTVTHAQTHVPIPGALVQLHFPTNRLSVVFETTADENGAFSFGTVNCGNTYQVSAGASGYLPKIMWSPNPPMEIPLSPGRTIRVTGTVRDGEGTPVSHAVIRLGRRGDPDMDGVDTYKFTPFRGVTKEDGTFAIEYVPFGDTLVPHVHHADYPDTAFSDAAIDTQRGDAHVDLVILPGLAVAGIVRFASGGMVSNAPVWAERVTKTEPDEWNKELTDSYQALGRTRTETNERGEFLVRRIGCGERFILKSGVRGYPSAFVGPYDPQHPAPSSVEIVISESGGRMAGKLSFADGTPATNATANRDVWRKDGPNLFSRATEPVALDIEEDGTYISGLLNPGTHDIGFTLGKADPVMRTVTIHDGGTELVDVIFTAPRAVTGVVLDATTSLPVAGVTISGRRADILRDRTGEDGVFMFAPQHWITLTFRHPDYATTEWRYNQHAGEERPIVLMSKGGDVLVRVTHADGTPASNMYLIVRDGMSDQHYAHPVCQGSLEYSEVMLTNVPCYPGDYRVGVYASDLKNDSLAESQLFTPTSGRVTVVPVTLEPLARFVVRFTDPVRMNTLQLSGRSRNREFTFHNFFSDNFVVRNNELSKDSVQPGTYDVTVQGESVSYVRTNLAFEAGRTTFLEILSGSNHVGAISGTVREAQGIPLDCTVSALPETIGAGADTDSVSDSDGVGANTWARNGEFRVDGLDLERIYTVRVTLYATRHTNIYIRGVRPDGPPLDIVLQAAYKVTGRVVDADGKGVSARVYCGQSAMPGTQTDESGEFRLHPAFPGVVLLNVAPAEFAPVTRAVPVANSDVDVGTIVVTDRGITVSGRIVNGRHQPLQGVNLNVSQSGGAGEAVTAPYEASVYSRGDGVFQLRGVPRGVRLKIHLAWGRRSLPGPELGLTDRDINIGDIVRSEPSDAEQEK